MKIKLKEGVSGNSYCTAKKDTDIMNKIQIYNVEKSLLDGLNELGMVLGFNTRSGLVRYLFKQFYNDFSYIIDTNASLYLFVDYEVDSIASKFLLDLQSKFGDSLEIISIKSNGNVSRLILCYDGDVNDLNGIIKEIVKLDGVIKIKFVGF